MPISQGDDWFVNWADFPFLAVGDSGMTAHWLQKSSEGTYNYDVKAAFYSQQTQTWGKGITIHKDGVSAEHGFVSMFAMKDGHTFISWLDGRNTAEKAPGETSGNPEIASGMTLRAGIFSRDGETIHDWELDGRTCDCCQTSAAMTASGPVVVYRDRSNDEIRDIYITRLIDNHWTSPVPVFSDEWKISGCPVNGPAVAARGHMTAVAWFSARDDYPKVSLAISDNDGESFGAPVSVAEGSTNGRTSIAVLASGNIAVSWLETDGPEAQLLVALYDRAGKQLAKVAVADTKASRRSGFPVIASRGDDVYVTWTDVSGSSQIKVARVRFLTQS